MLAARRFACLSAKVALPLLAAALPASSSLAADYALPVFGYTVDGDQAGPAEAQPASEQLADEQDADVSAGELECMAKVVMHEAGAEPHEGKVAVAQTLRNRLAAKRFGGSICQVANQPGQFFNTAAYHPDQGGHGWADAMAVSRAVLTGAEDDVAPGAIFFRTAAQPASGFFRTRQRVAAVGAQIFYR